MGLRELNIDFTKEHFSFWKETRKFVSEVIRPIGVELDKFATPEDVIADNSPLWDAFKKSIAMDYTIMNIPEDFGGLGIDDPLTMAILLEQFGWADVGLSTSILASSQPYLYAMMSPAPEMQELVKQFCADREGKMIGCWGITEPDHGGDSLFFEGEVAKNPECAYGVTAVADGDSYIINGQKAAWVSNGTIATHGVIWVSLDPSKGNQGGGILVMPLDLPGVTRGKPLVKMGQRSLNQGEIYFDNVRIPKYMMIADDPVMFRQLSNTQLGSANGGVGIFFTGLAQAAFEEALDYAKNRVQGGKPIIEHQNIKLKLYDMFASIEAARSLGRRVLVYNSMQIKQGRPIATHYGIAAKTFCTEVAFRVASQAVQIFGSPGLSKEFHIEQIFRDSRLGLIEDGVNESLMIEGSTHLAKGSGILNLKPENVQAAAPAAEGGMTWEDVEPVFRPGDSIKMGVMKCDAEKCTQCGLCILNCPFKCWEESEDKTPVLKEGYACFSCYNCMVACPTDAISIVSSYHATGGPFETLPHPLPAKMPLEPKDAEGNPAEWNIVEKTVLERRSIRNYKDDPVPEPLIRRVMEAGRFAPSSGNCQPWKFIAVTDQALMNELQDAVVAQMGMLSAAYSNDTLVKSLIPVFEADPNVGNWDPRVAVGGVGCIANGELPVFMNAPAMVIMAADTRAIAGPDLQIGICGQNMTLVAKSLGLGSCWVGFIAVLENSPEMKEKLGLSEPWKISNAMILGYPKFKQEGMVPREFRPVTWFRDGGSGPEIEE